MDVVIQHWLVAVAKAGKLAGAEQLNVPSDTDPAGAWALVSMATGLSPDDLAAVVAKHYRLEVADFDTVDLHAHRLLPARVARKLGVVPMQYSDRYLWAATADPVGLEAEKEITQVSGRSVHFRVAPPDRIGPALEAMYPDAEEVHEVPALEVAARGGPRILVVDDDEETRLLLRTFLEGAGFRVTEAEDGAKALKLLEDRVDPYALVTLDLDMPELPGLEALKRIRARVATASLPVVVATGLDDPDIEMALFEAGADDFIVKPVDPPRFLLRIQAVLRRQPTGFLKSLL